MTRDAHISPAFPEVDAADASADSFADANSRAVGMNNRRSSINNLGLEPSPLSVAVAKPPTFQAGAWFTDAEVNELVESYMDTVSCSGNAELNIRAWYEQAFPKDVPAHELERFNVAVFTRMAILIKPLKKLGRVGLVFRLVLVIVMSYSDMITDMLVIMQYYREGEMEYFGLALGFMVVTALMHAVFTYINLHTRPLSKSLPRIMAGLFLLNPLLDGYSVWSGKERDEGEMFTPMVTLSITRGTELLLESLPESVLQLTIFMTTENPTSLQKFSILSSVVASAFTMADTSVSSEQANMNAQRRGPYTNPVYGLVRNSTQGLLALYSSQLVFLLGYLSLNIVALASIITVKWPAFFVLLAVENCIWRFTVTRALGKYITGSQTVAMGNAFSETFMPAMAGILNYLPYLQFRHPSVVGGGKVMGGWIAYRWAWNVLTCLACGSMINAREDIVLTSSAFYGAVFTTAMCTVLGAIATYYACTPTHRKTLYSTKTGYDHHNDQFNGPTLQHENLNLETQRAGLIMGINPHFYSIDSVHNWVSTMQADNVLFEDPALLPKAVGPKVTPERFFEYIALVFQKHGTKDQQDAINAKLTELKEQVAAKHIT